jgi:hypothetical protein
MQPGEGQFPLRLRSPPRGDTAPGRLPCQVAEQHGLPDFWVAAQHNDPALARTHSVDDLVQHAALGAPVRQPFRASSEPGSVSHRTVSAPHPRDLATGYRY